MSDLIQKRVIKFILALVAIILTIYFAYLLINIIIISAIAILLYFIFAPFVKMLEGRGFSKTISALIVFAVFGFLIYGGLSYVIPKLYYQMNQLLIALKDISLNEELSAVEKKILGVFPLFNKGELSQKVQTFISTSFNDAINHVTQFLSGIISIIAVLIIVPFITFFILKDSSIIQKTIIHVIPNKYFEASYWVLKRISLQLGRFVRGWIFDATFVGLSIGFGFYFIGLPNALPLGVMAGLGHLIPYLGPVIGGVPAIILSIMQMGDFSQVPLIVMIVIITYSLDNGFVQPYVFSKSVDMHPIIIILLIITGNELLGIIGMLLAIPIATVIKTAATEIYFALKNYKIAKI